MYTNKDEIKKVLPDTSLEDSELNNISQAITNYINKYLGFVLASDEVEDILIDGSGTEFMFMSDPVASYEKLQKYSSGGFVDVDMANVLSYPLNKPYTAYFGLRRGVWNSELAGYKLTNAKKGMFTLETLPYEVKDLATKLAVKLINAGGVQLTTSATSSGVKTAETIGSYSVSYATNVLDTNKSEFDSNITASGVLDAYKQKVTVA